ncbi:MAG: TonB family protein, partial [Bryobacterales bacterium]|nr:TonB family protein [Bryobacterales bacterium]
MTVISKELDKQPGEHQQIAQPDAHLDRLLVATDLEEPWFKSIVRGIRETLNPPKLPPLELTSKPLEGGDFGNLQKLEEPWYKSFISNIRDIINPPKLPPLEVTSKPVEVGSIWGAYGGGETRSGAVSLGVHIGAVLLLLLIFQS